MPNGDEMVPVVGAFHCVPMSTLHPDINLINVHRASNSRITTLLTAAALLISVATRIILFPTSSQIIHYAHGNLTWPLELLLCHLWQVFRQK